MCLTSCARGLCRCSDSEVYRTRLSATPVSRTSPRHQSPPPGAESQPARKLKRVVWLDPESPGNIGDFPVRPLLAGLRDFGGYNAATCWILERVRNQKRITAQLLERSFKSSAYPSSTTRRTRTGSGSSSRPIAFFTSAALSQSSRSSWPFLGLPRFTSSRISEGTAGLRVIQPNPRTRELP